MITLNTPFTETYSGTDQHLIAQFAKHKTYNGIKTDLDRAKRLAPIYIKYGILFDLRSDFAWAQMEHETGFLTFTGDVKPNQNNFAGIGATGGVPGNSFGTEEFGVIAHFAHLAWYYYDHHVNEFCNPIYDPRHFILNGRSHYKYNGDESLQRLAGSWAVPGIEYAKRIFVLAKEIDNIFEQPDIPASKFDIIIQMGHVGRTSGYTGTGGEQVYVKKLGESLFHILSNTDLDIRLMGADNWLKPEPNLCKIFFALHCDGSLSPAAEGFSCGFKIGTNQRFKDIMAVKYKEVTGFTRRSDNNTDDMRNYYAWRDYSYKQTHVKADFYLLLEHGFFTNPAQRLWLNNHVNDIAVSHSNVIIEFLKNIN